MRLYSKEERDNAGFAIELNKRTLLSFPADSPDNQAVQDKAHKYLIKAQELLIESGFYSDEFDPSLAAY